MARLTKAQESYLRAALSGRLRFDAVRPAASHRCANALVGRGLLYRDSDQRIYRITPAGRQALSEGKEAGNG